MVVYGGTNDHGVVLDELWLLDLKINRWKKSNDTISNWSEGVMPPLMHHTMCGVIPIDLYKYNNVSIFSHPEYMTDMNNVRKLKIGF